MPFGGRVCRGLRGRHVLPWIIPTPFGYSAFWHLLAPGPLTVAGKNGATNRLEDVEAGIVDLPDRSGLGVVRPTAAPRCHRRMVAHASPVAIRTRQIESRSHTVALRALTRSGLGAALWVAPPPVLGQAACIDVPQHAPTNENHAACSGGAPKQFERPISSSRPGQEQGQNAVWRYVALPAGWDTPKGHWHAPHTSLGCPPPKHHVQGSPARIFLTLIRISLYPRTSRSGREPMGNPIVLATSVKAPQATIWRKNGRS